MVLPSEVEVEYELVQECPFDPPHSHIYPSDWQFGAASGTDPSTDPRYCPTTYVYLDEKLHIVWTTSMYKCEDEALDAFSRWGQDGAVYIQAKQSDGDLELLDWKYDFETDTVYPLGA